ncbi:MAG TPA: hypothetical protein VM782_14150 [Stellaceae bacterium]|nr:hypothetical protein [Stellaceae bacterium]
MADTYADRFGHPPWISQHAIERMNTLGISPRQLADALNHPAIPGISPGTVNFVGDQVTAVVNEDGMIVTVYETR